jgi:hypothetical protein
MAKLICKGDDLGFTILPHDSISAIVEKELLENPSDKVLGYVTRERKFRYTESGKVTEVNEHWSLDILEEFPYVEQDGPWIVYTCSPEDAQVAFHKIGGNEVLHIHNWDTWSITGKESNVAVVTSFEIY